MARHVDSDFIHDIDDKRIDLACPNAHGIDIDAISMKPLQ
jgi:hypothetical protein